VLVKEKPWVTVLVIRLTALPSAVKNYGLGALDADVVPFTVTAVVTLAAISYVLADLGSKIEVRAHRGTHGPTGYAPTLLLGRASSII
jgi:hypothetical protein